MKWLKENWFKLLVLVLFSVFIYFQFVRPVIYKKYCASRVYGIFDIPLDRGDDAYKVCLRKYGL